MNRGIRGATSCFDLDHKRCTRLLYGCGASARREHYVNPQFEGVSKMKMPRLAAMVVAVLFSMSSAFAVPPGKTVELAGGGGGKGGFDGKGHADKGLKCPDCHPHPKPFGVKNGSGKDTKTEIHSGKVLRRSPDHN